jgi:NAD(P)H-dependent flavin oxidoreductase YrpB (nitropropane dioxygenase family)
MRGQPEHAEPRRLSAAQRLTRAGRRGPVNPFRLRPCTYELLANFVEVWLAKEGHDGPVGINLLTKVQMPNLASLYGAMLAGVDYVLMGAGIPKEIPGVLDRLAAHEPASDALDVEAAAATPST